MEEEKQGFDQRLIVLAVFALVAVGVVAAILISRSGGGEGGSSASSACTEEEAPQGTKSLPCPDLEEVPPDGSTVTVKTNFGAFTIDLATEEAPLTTASVAYLVEQGFYDGLTFHRVAPEFVIQGGDPEGTGSGGPGYSVVEKPPSSLKYTKGVVAMAKTGTDPPGTSGSQFFVVLAAEAGLPPEYALVGKVAEGMGTVETIGELPTEGETPKRRALIESMTIEKG
jgi:peptidyl-prolyl cis-trans isomerase B (cyclophilin B)